MNQLPTDRRRIHRSDAETICPLVLRPQSGTAISARPVDFSITGIGVIADSAVDAGTILTIECDRPGRHFPVPLTIEVRYASQLANGRWRLGCRFSRLLTADDLLSFG